MSGCAVGSSTRLPLIVAFSSAPPSLGPTPTLPVTTVSPSLMMTLPPDRPRIVKPPAAPRPNAAFGTGQPPQATVIEAEALLSLRRLGSSLSAETVAVFGSWPQLAAAVVALTVTENEAPSAKVNSVQVNTPLLIEHSLLSGVSVQVRPAGSVS